VYQEDKEFSKAIYQFRGIDAWGPEKFEIRAQALSPFTQMYVLRRTLVAKAEMY
jgi:hypothetical protein